MDKNFIYCLIREKYMTKVPVHLINQMDIIEQKDHQCENHPNRHRQISLNDLYQCFLF